MSIADVQSENNEISNDVSINSEIVEVQPLQETGKTNSMDK